ncbi:AAA family ATPase [bacterium 0.1xD8-71]|nr:AAA family ATPase [bacterium 0.1xD8-71]
MSDKENSRVRSKNMMYTQQIRHLPARSTDQLVSRVKKMAPKRYALIVHDSDVNEQGEPAEDHVHVMLSFENARSINSIARELGDEPQSIEMWKGKAENGYSYLIHATKDSGNKYQYPPSKVIANFNYQEEIKRITEEVERSRQTANSKILLDSLYKGEISKEELEKRLSGSQYGRMRRQIEDVWCKHLQFQAAKWREEMKKSGKRIKVIWISGEAGTGKTSLAKEYAEKSNQPYFITGSSRDLFQNYAGEHTMIIDELRADIVKYPDLLRILDPFGSQVMAPSRYSDKPLVCDLILITSPYNPAEFYRELFSKTNGDSVDGLEQLLRRITLTVEMDVSHIRAVEYDRGKKIYRAVDKAEKENRYSRHYREQDSAASNPQELFESMFREAPCVETDSTTSVESA